MNYNRENYQLCVRKYLLSMQVDETRSVEAYKCKYSTIKATCYQLKKLGCGEWKVQIKHGVAGSFTRVVRVK